AEQVIGSRCADNILRHVSDDGHNLCEEGCPLAAVLQDGRTRDLIAYMHHRDGRRLAVHIRALPLEIMEHEPAVLEVFDEITDRSKLLEELESLRQEVIIDPLTKLGNRRFFEFTAEARMQSWENHHIPFGLLMFDIDHFKRVNDTWGHLAGDPVLHAVGGTIASAIRPLDAAARYGGEEFAVLVPNCSPGYLLMVGERIRTLVENSWLDLENGQRLTVTISGGGAMVREGDTLASLVARADEALYESKEQGRNRITLSPS
ncbi:MAG: GGDEF domain-containing protein, partial [Rectinema sp.]|nr:GGDEF domain-containing protein [Rectinema sp.]